MCCTNKLYCYYCNQWFTTHLDHVSRLLYKDCSSTYLMHELWQSWFFYGKMILNRQIVSIKMKKERKERKKESNCPPVMWYWWREPTMETYLWSEDVSCFIDYFRSTVLQEATQLCSTICCTIDRVLNRYVVLSLCVYSFVELLVCLDARSWLIFLH